MMTIMSMIRRGKRIVGSILQGSPDLSSTKPSHPPPTTLNAFADLQNDDHYVVKAMVVITTEKKLYGNRK